MDTRQYALTGKGCMNQSPCKFLFIMAGEHAGNSYNIHKIIYIHIHRYIDIYLLSKQGQTHTNFDSNQIFHEMFSFPEGLNQPMYQSIRVPIGIS